MGKKLIKFKCPSCKTEFWVRMEEKYATFITKTRSFKSSLIGSVEEMLKDFKEDWF